MSAAPISRRTAALAVTTAAIGVVGASGAQAVPARTAQAVRSATYSGRVIAGGARGAKANIRSAPSFSARVIGTYGPHATVIGTRDGEWIRTSRGWVSLGTLHQGASKPSSINGRIPRSQMTALPLAWNTPANVGGKGHGHSDFYTPTTPRYLFPIPAAQLAALQKEFRAEFGRWAPIDLAYRSLDGQRYWYARLGSPTAARPGTSNHGYALAVDVQEGKGEHAFAWGRPGSRWLQKNAQRFGFENPFPYGPAHESYHYQFVG